MKEAAVTDELFPDAPAVVVPDMRHHIARKELKQVAILTFNRFFLAAATDHVASMLGRLSLDSDETITINYGHFSGVISGRDVSAIVRGVRAMNHKGEEGKCPKTQQ